MVAVKVGVWVESRSRELTGHTSYAADWITHVSVAGEYPLYLTFQTGYLIPMPDRVGATLVTEIVDGAYHSGFGGVNFAVTKPGIGPSTYHVGGYAYELQALIDAGTVRLDPGMEWATAAREHVKAMGWDWPDIRVMSGE